MSRCECDWKWHQGQPCSVPAAEYENIRTSPELCTPCLFACEGEREDEMDGLVAEPVGEQR